MDTNMPVCKKMKQNQLHKIGIALKYLLEIKVFRERWCFYVIASPAGIWAEF